MPTPRALTWERQWNAGNHHGRLGGLRPDRHTAGAGEERGRAVGFDLGAGIARAAGVHPHRPERESVPLRRAGCAALEGAHEWTAGFDLLRRQFNGIETDCQRGFFAFGNDFGRDSITNLRMGTPTQNITATGDVFRGFRNWDMQFYAGDKWQVRRESHAAIRPALSAGDDADGGEREEHDSLSLRL